MVVNEQKSKATEKGHFQPTSPIRKIPLTSEIGSVKSSIARKKGSAIVSGVSTPTGNEGHGKTGALTEFQ